MENDDTLAVPYSTATLAFHRLASAGRTLSCTIRAGGVSWLYPALQLFMEVLHHDEALGNLRLPCAHNEESPRV